MTDVRREQLLDVSRLIWRLWSGRLPTGIDRVCLEYVRYFAPRSLAVLQFRGRILVFGAAASDRLFAVLVSGKRRPRWRLAAAIAAGIAQARKAPPAPGMVYLNVGHTGLDNPALPAWVARNRVRAVYLVHDLIPLTHPQFCRAGEATRHSIRMRNALTSASGIIGNSDATIDALKAFASEAGLPMPPFLRAWISGSPRPSNVVSRRLERPYFVAVGTIEGRKNHILLLRAWQRLVARLGKNAPILVIIGQRGWEAQEATSILDGGGGLGDSVRELGDCDDADLSAWLAGARALLMPSHAEGFGLPVIEAIALGTPVIATDLAVYREVVGDIPTYLDPEDADAWESTVADFMNDGGEYARQKRAAEGYSPPDWPGHFADIDAWLASVRERSNPAEPGEI